MTLNEVQYSILSLSDLDPAGVRLEAPGGILGGESALNGGPVEFDVILNESQLWQRMTLGDFDLSLNQIDARLFFRYSVFHLYSCKKRTI